MIDSGSTDYSLQYKEQHAAAKSFQVRNRLQRSEYEMDATNWSPIEQPGVNFESARFIYSRLATKKRVEPKHLAEVIILLELLPKDQPTKYPSPRDLIHFSVPGYLVEEAIHRLVHNGFVRCKPTGISAKSATWSQYSGEKPNLNEGFALKLTNTGESIARTLKETKGHYLSRLKEILATLENVSEEELALRKKIEQYGGYYPMWGLYTQNRRVRARRMSFSDESAWEICVDEVDLIEATGLDRVPHFGNKVDLERNFGLQERLELAPIECVTGNSFVDIQRTDYWGEGSKPYRKIGPWWKNELEITSIRELCRVIALSIFFIISHLTEYLSSRVSTTLFFVLLIPIVWIDEWRALPRYLALIIGFYYLQALCALYIEGPASLKKTKALLRYSQMNIEKRSKLMDTKSQMTRRID